MVFQIDSGASRTIISRNTFNRFFASNRPKLYAPDIQPVTWGDECTLKVMGRFFTEARFKNITKFLPVMVGKADGTNLLGRNWFIPFGLSVAGINSLEPGVDFNPSLEDLKQLPAVSGEGTGCYRGPPLNPPLHPLARPVYHRARRVPFALTSKMEEAINANVVKGMWVPMRYAGPWASPLVPVPNNNGTLRLCTDYSATVNPSLPMDSYRTSTSEEIFASLSLWR